MKAKIGLDLNVTYQLRDRFGDIKPLFQENKLFRLLLKKGFLSPNFWKIPFLFGTWQEQKLVSNLITNAGAAGVADLIGPQGSTAPYAYIAVGTGATAANVTDTTLQTETATSGLSRALGTTSRVTTDVTNDTAQITKTFSVSGTVAVTESGVFNAASTGTLLARQTFSAINVVNGDSLTITWKIDVD